MKDVELKREILDFLRGVAIMSIAVNSRSRPISSVVIFAVDDDFNFYFVTHVSSFKARALEVDSQISLSVWKKDKMLIQASGRAERLSTGVEIESGMDRVVKSLDSLGDLWPPLLRLEEDEYAVYKIKPDWLRKLDLKSDKIHDKKLPMTQIVLD